jgi:myosin heavy subunit
LANQQSQVCDRAVLFVVMCVLTLAIRWRADLQREIHSLRKQQELEKAQHQEEVNKCKTKIKQTEKLAKRKETEWKKKEAEWKRQLEMCQKEKEEAVQREEQARAEMKTQIEEKISEATRGIEQKERAERETAMKLESVQAKLEKKEKELSSLQVSPLLLSLSILLITLCSAPYSCFLSISALSLPLFRSIPVRSPAREGRSQDQISNRLVANAPRIRPKTVVSKSLTNRERSEATRTETARGTERRVADDFTAKRRRVRSAVFLFMGAEIESLSREGKRME